jgi:hypothetical protein
MRRFLLLVAGIWALLLGVLAADLQARGWRLAIGTRAAPTMTSGNCAAAADTTASYLLQTADTSLTNSFAMGSLSTGLIKNTATTGVQSIYAGASCTNQFVRSLDASGAATCAGIGVNDFTANQGTTTQALFGNAAGQPSWQPTANYAYAANDVNVSSSSTPSTVVTMVNAATVASGIYSFHCVLAALGTATSAPRFEVLSSGAGTAYAYTVVGFKTSATTATTETFAVSTYTATCTSGCLTTSTVWTIDGVIVPSAVGASITVQMESSTNGQQVTASKGSYCSWYSPS